MTVTKPDCDADDAGASEKSENASVTDTGHMSRNSATLYSAYEHHLGARRSISLAANTTSITTLPVTLMFTTWLNTSPSSKAIHSPPESLDYGLPLTYLLFRRLLPQRERRQKHR